MGADTNTLRHELKVLLGKMEHLNDEKTLDKICDILGAPAQAAAPVIVTPGSTKPKKQKNAGDPE